MEALLLKDEQWEKVCQTAKGLEVADLCHYLWLPSTCVHFLLGKSFPEWVRGEPCLLLSKLKDLILPASSVLQGAEWTQTKGMHSKVYAVISFLLVLSSWANGRHSWGITGSSKGDTGSIYFSGDSVMWSINGGAPAVASSPNGPWATTLPGFLHTTALDPYVLAVQDARLAISLSLCLLWQFPVLESSLSLAIHNPGWRRLDGEPASHFI